MRPAGIRAFEARTEGKTGVYAFERQSPAELSDEKKEPVVPQLLILSSGELSPFRLRLEERGAGGNAYALASDGYQLPSAEMDSRP